MRVWQLIVMASVAGLVVSGCSVEYQAPEPAPQQVAVESQPKPKTPTSDFKTLEELPDPRQGQYILAFTYGTEQRLFCVSDPLVMTKIADSDGWEYYFSEADAHSVRPNARLVRPCRTAWATRLARLRSAAASREGK